ncbi:MAG: type II toxin-antitoxin system VapC family toxin [Dehalococcoidia bacterium]
MSRLVPPNPQRLLVDSTVNLALLDSNDNNHATARDIQQHLVIVRPRLFTTNYLFDESYTLIMSHLGRNAAITFLDDIRASSFTIVRISEVDEARAEGILRQYQDKAFSYTDATSFAIMERLQLDSVFAFDRDFEQYGASPLYVV